MKELKAWEIVLVGFCLAAIIYLYWPSHPDFTIQVTEVNDSFKNVAYGQSWELWQGSPTEIRKYKYSGFIPKKFKFFQYLEDQPYDIVPLPQKYGEGYKILILSDNLPDKKFFPKWGWKK